MPNSIVLQELAVVNVDESQTQQSAAVRVGDSAQVPLTSRCTSPTDIDRLSRANGS